MKLLIKKIFSVWQSALLLLLMALLLWPSSVQAQKKKKKKPNKFSMEAEFGLATFYDDNILKYSYKYLDRFVNNKDEGRFHIKTYDDVIVNPSVGLSASYRLFGKRKTTVDADASMSFYLVNDIKNWQIYNVGIRQEITRRFSLGFSYIYIPEFYVRHFRDDDWTPVVGFTPESFTAYSFAKNNYAFVGDYTFSKNTRVRFYYYYMQYYHNPNYTEYDSKNNMFRLRLTQPLSQNFEVDLSYQYETSDAKGYDEPGETKETSDDSDASYIENGINAGLTWKLPRVKKHFQSLTLNAVFYNAVFQTDKPVLVDPLHAGRVDHDLRIYLNYYLSVSKRLKFKAYFNWLGRDSGTTSILNETYVSNEKDYRQNQVGIAVTYKIDLLKHKK
jgi:hypothetical protein